VRKDGRGERKKGYVEEGRKRPCEGRKERRTVEMTVSLVYIYIYMYVYKYTNIQIYKYT
jgi:hypothetical protein